MGKNKEDSADKPEDERAVPTASFAGGSAGLGAQVGRYKLLSALGEGGYGVVYLAKQERPIKRRVALKLIKTGMDSKEVSHLLPANVELSIVAIPH